jgi:signal transduction histidine kinase/CheY-like chemotaxis protein
VFDSSRGLICWNKRFVEMHDLPPGLLRIGCRYEELVPHLTEGGEAVDSKGDGSLADPAALIARVQSSDEKRLRFERQRADGSTIEITVTLTPDGGFVKTYSDITDRVVAEDERAKLLERFHTNQKMEAIGTLAGGVAHDFNNILGIIIGYCDLLGDEIPATGPAGEMLRQVAKAGERAKLLVQQILTYSRNFDCTLEPCDIAQEVRNSCDLLASSIPPNIVLTLDRVESSTVAADRAQIHQILLNLITNSVHAIGDRPGTIAVSVAPARPEAAGVNGGAEPQKARRETDRSRRASRIVIGTVKDIPYCRIAVRDSGGGIDPVVMSRIFEPFFTTKEVGKGTGLGLAVVYGIARNHDGVIEVESASGRGVEFNIYLPVLAAQRAGEAPANDASGLAGSERVLLVDDDKVLLLVQKSLLEKLGYRVEAFNNPGKALEALRAEPQRWDLVITDRNMASMNGEEFAARVLQRRPMAPVIMCTGYLDLADETRILGLGVRSILMKPVTGAKLSAAIRAAMQPPAGLEQIRARPA